MGNARAYLSAITRGPRLHGTSRAIPDACRNDPRRLNLTHTALAPREVRRILELVGETAQYFDSTAWLRPVVQVTTELSELDQTGDTFTEDEADGAMCVIYSHSDEAAIWIDRGLTRDEAVELLIHMAVHARLPYEENHGELFRLIFTMAVSEFLDYPEDKLLEFAGALTMYYRIPLTTPLRRLMSALFNRHGKASHQEIVEIISRVRKLRSRRT